MFFKGFIKTYCYICCISDVVSSKDNTVEIKLEFEGQKTKWIESTGLEVISLIGVVKLVCHLKVNDVRVTISTRKPIVCSPESVFVGDISKIIDPL